MSRIYSSLQLVETEKQEHLNGRPLLNTIEEKKTSAEQESDLKHGETETEKLELASVFDEKSPPGELNTHPLSAYFAAMANHIKSTLGSIRGFTELSQSRFKDAEFGNNFHRMVTEDIDKTDSELDCFLGYMKMKSPVRRKNTVHHLLEALLRDHEKKLKDKKIKIVKKQYDNELPETSVQDEQLRYILNWVLQYAILTAAPNGNIGVLTKCFDIQEAKENGKRWVSKEWQYIEILIAFTGGERPAEPVGAVPGPQATPRENGKNGKNGKNGQNFILPLVEEIVQENRGMMKIKVDQEKQMNQISLILPVERRKVIQYQPAEA